MAKNYSSKTVFGTYMEKLINKYYVLNYQIDEA